jgi:Tetratricopeptide repeat
MKRWLTLNLLAFFIPSFIPFAAPAQDEARARWQVMRFDITANVRQSERQLSATAVLTIKNAGEAAGSRMTLRINSRARVNMVSANGASATFHALAESRGNMQPLNINLPTPVAANAELNLTVTYSVPVETNTGLQAISPIGSQFLPLSFWYPVLNTPYTIRGADTAPFKLKIEGANVISSGVEKGPGTYEQALFALPFFLEGDWDKDEGSGEARGIVALLPKGAGEEKKQADAMIAAAASARSFYATLFRPAPEVPIRLVAVRRGAGFNDAGTVLIEWAAFRRAKLDSLTAMVIAESMARLWIGAQTPIRGEGAEVLRDSLARYLALLFVEKQFGREAAEAEMTRERIAYANIAKRDVPLSRSTHLDDTYYNSVPNKGAMVWRLVERRIGRDNFIRLLRSFLQPANAEQSGLSLATVRAKLADSGGDSVKKLLDQELDQPADMDLMIGLPQQRGNEWVSALRNLGSIDATVTVAATTDRGEQIKVETTVPAHDFAEAAFKTPTKPVRVEIDPDKLYPQLDYTNDVAPRVRDVSESMGEASRFFGAQDYAHAETVAREIMTAAPQMQEARILLARSLLGQNKLDEAERLFRATLDEALPTAITIAWANVGLGEIALKKGQAAEAARRFNDAVRADAEYAASLAARAGRLKAETSPPIDDSVRAFLTQLDRTITNGSKADLDAKIVSGELVRFVGGIVGTKPEVWQTRVLRTESLGDDLIAADVTINTKTLGKEASGTAVLILARVNGVLKLAGVELFEVR